MTPPLVPRSPFIVIEVGKALGMIKSTAEASLPPFSNRIVLWVALATASFIAPDVVAGVKAAALDESPNIDCVSINIVVAEASIVKAASYVDVSSRCLPCVSTWP